MKDRYLAQFWSKRAGRFVTDCAFQDSDEQLKAAKRHVNNAVKTAQTEMGRVYDQKTDEIVHTRHYIPF